jgi:hypothetical protein
MPTQLEGRLARLESTLSSGLPFSLHVRHWGDARLSMLLHEDVLRRLSTSALQRLLQQCDEVIE